MVANTTEGRGHGSAEGPIRGLGRVDKIFKKDEDLPAFKIDGQEVRSELEDGDVMPTIIAEDVILIPVGNLSSTNLQDGMEEHQSDIDATNINVATNTSDIATNTMDLTTKADKVLLPIIGDFAAFSGTGNLANSGKGPDDYYTKTQIDAQTTGHLELTGVQGGNAGEQYHLLGDEHTNLSGGVAATPTFDTVTLTGAITVGTQATDKDYVDGAVAGVTAWLPAVGDFFDPTGGTPVGPIVGDRYISTATANGWTINNIYEWSVAWDETVVIAGNSTYVDAEGVAYVFTNAVGWVATGGVSNHNALGGLQGGTAPNYWHLNTAAKNFAESVNIAGVLNHQFIQYDSTTSKWTNVDNPTEAFDIAADTVITITTGIYLIDTSTGNVQLTIPDSTINNDGDVMGFFKTTRDENVVTVITSGGQNIGGITTQTISKNNQGFSAISHFVGTPGWHITQNNRSDKLIVTVSPVAGEAEYQTIAAAISHINAEYTPSIAQQFVIQLTPGIFTEAPFIVPDYVSVIGVTDESTFVTASNANAAFIQLQSYSVLYNLKVIGPTNETAILVSNGDSSEIRRCVIETAKTGIKVTGVGSHLFLEETKIKDTVLTGVWATNSGWVGASNIFNEATTTSFYADNGTILIHNSFASGAVSGLYANNGGTIQPYLITLINCTYAVRSGTGANYITGSTVYSVRNIPAVIGVDYDILQSNGLGRIYLTACTFLRTLLNLASPSSIFVDFNSNATGDEGREFLEELHVGIPELGRETVLGEGDSYIRGMKVLTQVPAGAYTDVTTAASSTSGSTFTIGTAVNNAIYFTSTLVNETTGKPVKFLGIKALVILSKLGGSIICEYWNGSSWTEIKTMSTDANSPYLPHANDVFGRNNSSEQIRFGFDMLTDWALSTITGTNAYWARLRVATAISRAPVIEQIKIHSNRTEINNDGWMEFMGQARPIDFLPWDAGLFQGANDSPSNQDLYVGDNLAVGRIENLFTNNATDRIGMLTPLPTTVDTSCPISFKWSVRSTEGGGNIAWVIRWAYTSEGSSVYTSVLDAPATAVNQQTITYTTAAPTAANITKWYSVDLDISEMVSRRSGTNFPDTLWLSIERTSGDTHGGEVALIAIKAEYVKWCLGGHYQ